ncbi:hypothetical protein N657DRAFT_376381 [Parathielavia appendiculata]|uniref:Rhodopsin domain-containing protein n=1 Tax=Parathielavia appendiculata TaxID=2587402 RepID=A0AAN6Z4Q8_9PEZI|nr:hypothetical protein N657DRAFT_376381 [Parathielavia appendiculata]
MNRPWAPLRLHCDAAVPSVLSRPSLVMSPTISSTVLMHLHVSAMTRRDDSAPREVPNYAGRLLWAIWTLTIASAVFLALRVYCRLSRNRSLWWDDWFLIASWVTVLVSTALLTEATKWGVGLHYDDMELEKMPVMSLLSYIAGFSTILGAAWSKTSFAVTLLRISEERWTKWLIWFIIISVNVVLGVSATILWISCWPIPKLWYYNMEGTCWPKHIVEQYQTFTSIYSGTLDIVLAILPWKIIWALTINKREKLGVMVAMSMGTLAGIVAFLKLMSLDDISDDTSTAVDIKVFGTAEPAISIIAASIPVLRAFIRKNATKNPRSVTFVHLSDYPRSRSQRSITSAKKGSDEVLVTNASRMSHTAADNQNFALQDREPGTSAAGTWGRS